ncbi:unnamed protein product [Rhodiola kirilowii]
MRRCSLITSNALKFTLQEMVMKRLRGSVCYSTLEVGDWQKANGRSTLAADLAFLVEETSEAADKVEKPKTRAELKRSYELQIKKRVKEQFANGKYHDILGKVVANPDTLRDAYNCIRISSNVEPAVDVADMWFECVGRELSDGSFDVKANTYAISTKGVKKEVLVLPNLRLKVIQEAIRIALEVVYRPHFSKISHGCRSGRGRSSALRYICKEVSDPDWWFTILIGKEVDGSVVAKLISILEDKVNDPSLYGLIRSFVDANVLNLQFGGFPKGQGLPQEGVLSPILMNIYLDLLDRELYRLCMKYEALHPTSCGEQSEGKSNLRRWFRRNLDKNIDVNQKKCITRLHSCRYMDEIFVSVSGSKDIAEKIKSEVEEYLHNSLMMDVEKQPNVLPCDGTSSIQFLGVILKRNVNESPATRAVHKLKDKVEMLASQKQEAWDAGTVRIGKKWLGHGLKKVKESEIKQLADPNSTVVQISRYRKAGMKTDHWYKELLKIWMQDVNAKAIGSEDKILSKYIAEPVVPQALYDSFYEFQRQAQKYISEETAKLVNLLPNNQLSTESSIKTECIIPLTNITKRLLRYSLTTSEGYPRTSRLLVLLDSDQIIDWFSGITHRWCMWYNELSNYEEIKTIISYQVRKSCIRTLAGKYRIHEDEIEKKFDSELVRIPSTLGAHADNDFKIPQSAVCDYDEALFYGISYSGLCLLSLARIVSEARPCNCFVMGCSAAAPRVYTLHVMERQKFPGWLTGFPSCIHPSLNKRRMGLCNKHLKDLFLGDISLQSVDFGAWKK